MENAKIFKELQGLEREVQELKHELHANLVGNGNNPCCEVFLTEKSYGHPSGLALDASSACNSSAESGRVDDELRKKAKPKLAIGQVWKNEMGWEVKIVEYNAGRDCHWKDDDGLTYTDKGCYFLDGSTSKFDLVELISDAPAECNQSDTKPSIPKPLTKEPLMGRTYYTLSPDLSHSVWCEWCDTVADKIIFDNGLAFETGKEASEAAKFMLQAWKQALKGSEN